MHICHGHWAALWCQVWLVFVSCIGFGGVLVSISGQFGSGRPTGRGFIFIAPRGAESGHERRVQPESGHRYWRLSALNSIQNIIMMISCEWTLGISYVSLESYSNVDLLIDMCIYTIHLDFLCNIYLSCYMWPLNLAYLLYNDILRMYFFSAIILYWYLFLLFV